MLRLFTYIKNVIGNRQFIKAGLFKLLPDLGTMMCAVVNYMRKYIDQLIMIVVAF